MKQLRHDWTDNNFVKDKTRGVCSRCGLTRELHFQRTPFVRTYFVYGKEKSKHRPDCIKIQTTQLSLL